MELTVGWPDPCVTAETVVRAYDAASPYAYGFGLWGRRPELAADVLPLMPA